MPNFAKRLDGITGSAIRELFKLAAKADIISFGGGNPSPESFDVDMIARFADDALAAEGKRILQYGLTEGWTELRKVMLERIHAQGIKAEMDNLICVTGSMQGNELLTKAFIDPGDAIIVESPTFLGALQGFKSMQAKLVPVEMDDDGIIIEELEEKIKKYRPKLIYTIPTFQNPTGKTLSLERRKRMAKLASEYDVIVMEDDPYCDLRYYGDALPSIKSFDTTENVVLLNSFSKTISPGLRVGTALGRADILRKMTILKQSSDVHTASLTQAIVVRYITSGELDKHIVDVCNDYRVRLDCMLDAVRANMPEEAKCTKPEGGLFVWVTLPKGVDTNEMFKESVKRGVAFIPGESFFVDPEQGKNCMRLNFSSCSCEQIDTGMKLLGGLVKETIAAL